jgi:hypothetical protein
VFRSRIAALIGLALAIPLAASAPANAAAGLPRPGHVVVAVMENHSHTEIIGNSSAPYITSLASQAANFSQSFAVTHPSESNYLEGTAQKGETSGPCP